MAAQTIEGEELIATIKNAAGLILAVTENRNWIEVFFEGDLMHTQTVNLTRFQYVGSAMVSTVLLLLFQSNVVSKHRKRAGIKYPQSQYRYLDVQHAIA